MPRKKETAADKAEAALRRVALGYPEAWEDFPWGERAIKVRKKIFACVNRTKEGGSSLTVKLGASNREALLLPFTEPTHYGMGKHGWVTSRFDENQAPPLVLLCDWIEESYRAIAPKKLVALLDEDEAATPAKKKATRKKATKKKATKKKVTKHATRKATVRKKTGRSR